MTSALSIHDTKALIASTRTKEQYHIAVIPTDFGHCVEFRDFQTGNLIWRLKSSDRDFGTALKQKLDKLSELKLSGRFVLCDE